MSLLHYLTRHFLKKSYVNLRLVLYEYETWSVMLKEEHKSVGLEEGCHEG